RTQPVAGNGRPGAHARQGRGHRLPGRTLGGRSRHVVERAAGQTTVRLLRGHADVLRRRRDLAVCGRSTPRHRAPGDRRGARGGGAGQAHADRPEGRRRAVVAVRAWPPIGGRQAALARGLPPRRAGAQAGRPRGRGPVRTRRSAPVHVQPRHGHPSLGGPGLPEDRVSMPTDLDISRAAELLPIPEVAASIGLGEHLLEPYGHSVSKISLAAIDELADRPPGKYVVVSSITPTPLGEGKTTTTVGLGQAFGHLGKNAVVAVRQPSMGPTFGIKGGAAGGGYAQVAPMETVNLHLTGDLHAVTSAHNLLAAMIDNHLHKGNKLGIDPFSITWRRVIDVNDRDLRQIVTGLGGKADGVPRQTG